jgi:hypothetical protein
MSNIKIDQDELDRRLIVLSNEVVCEIGFSYLPSAQTDHRTHSIPRRSVPNPSCDLIFQIQVSRVEDLELKFTRNNAHQIRAIAPMGIRTSHC